MTQIDPFDRIRMEAEEAAIERSEKAQSKEQLMDEMVKPSGRSINCARCGGHGLVVAMGEPDECPDCGGSGRNWQYPRGAIARYYSGPLIGRAQATSRGGEK